MATNLEQAGTAAMLQNQHDKFFKSIFSRSEHAADLLRTSLPPAVLVHLDLGSLELAPGSFVDDDMRERFTDLLYRVNLAGRQALVYLLLEHKSTADALTALFMARYVIDILSDHVRKHPHTRALPAVIPLVVHHGAGGWNAASSLMQLYDLPADQDAPGLRQALAGRLLDIELTIDDISQQSDDELRSRAMNAVVTLVMMLLVKSLSGSVLAEEIEQCADLFAQVTTSASGLAAMALIVQYIMSKADVSPQELDEIFRRVLGPAIHEAYMNTAEMIHKQGLEQGLEQGMERGLEQGLEQGRSTLRTLLEDRFGSLPEAAEKRIGAAGFEQLKAWTRAVLRANTLDEIFDA